MMKNENVLCDYEEDLVLINKYKSEKTIRKTLIEYRKIKEKNEEDKGLIPIFIFLGKTPEIFPYDRSVSVKNEFKIKKGYDSDKLKSFFDKNSVEIQKIYRELYKNIKTDYKYIKFNKIIANGEDLIYDYHILIYVNDKDIDSIENKFSRLILKHNLDKCKFEIYKETYDVKNKERKSIVSKIQKK